MRLGVFGGTFDPVHLAHLILAEQCREQARLDRVLFIPAARMLGHLHGAALPALTADTDARRIFTMIAKGRSTASANPTMAAIVPLLLRFEPLGKKRP